MTTISDDGYDGTQGEEFVKRVHSQLLEDNNVVLSRGCGLALINEVKAARHELELVNQELARREDSIQRLHAHFQVLASKVNRVATTLRQSVASPIDTIREIIEE